MNNNISIRILKRILLKGVVAPSWLSLVHSVVVVIWHGAVARCSPSCGCSCCQLAYCGDSATAIGSTCVLDVGCSLRGSAIRRRIRVSRPWHCQQALHLLREHRRELLRSSQCREGKQHQQALRGRGSILHQQAYISYVVEVDISPFDCLLMLPSQEDKWQLELRRRAA